MPLKKHCRLNEFLQFLLEKYAFYLYFKNMSDAFSIGISYSAIFTALLASYCFFLNKRPETYKKHLLYSCIAAAIIVSIYTIYSEPISYETLVFIPLFTLIVSIPQIVATAIYFLFSKRLKPAIAIGLAFTGGAILMLPVLVPQYGVSMMTMLGLVIACGLTGNCL